MDESSRSLFGRFHTLALIVIFVAAAAIRLYDLTDLPLDFHPTRQLFSALKARGMYYEALTDAPAEQREFAIQQGKMRATIEPEILERLTVFTWKFTGERLWVAEITDGTELELKCDPMPLWFQKAVWDKIAPAS